MEKETKKPTGLQLLINFWFILCLITNTIHLMVDITSKNITHELILIFIIYFGIRTADSLDKKEDEDKKNPKISQKERESESESVAILIIIFWVAGIIYLWNIW